MAYVKIYQSIKTDPEWTQTFELANKNIATIIVTVCCIFKK